jgi:hypothetical protein
VVVKNISIILETLNWFPLSWPPKRPNMTLFRATKLKKLALQKYLGSTCKFENKVFFLLFAFPNLDALDFT